ncbi:hypothetical protein V5799_010524 [Amblyomma americanum]|uniref:SH3 domain-containing protein n=1 Tax=Amblyomma americanum TaxID=6943 RepID=A0AAQ4EKG7_AMBAM
MKLSNNVQVGPSRVAPPTPNSEAPSQTVIPAGTTPSGNYVALYSYKPQKEDELELRKNELYSVTEKCQDGWFKGTSLRTGLSGVFPGNYVQPAK